MAMGRQHPNRAAFHGVLARLDEASDRPPAGARGKRVLLKRSAAERALESLIGMAVDVTPKLDGHDSRRKAGVITRAWIDGQDLKVAGHIFVRDFPEVMTELRRRGAEMGLSYEVSDARVKDAGAAVWELSEVTFTGAAMLRRDKAAYSKTWVKTGEAEERKMEEMAERMVTAAEAMSAVVERLQAQMDEKIERIVAAVEDASLEKRVAELEAENTQLRRASARKTVPATVTQMLAKNGVEVRDEMDAAALDASLTALSVEQRIAVKSQMAKAGLIG